MAAPPSKAARSESGSAAAAVPTPVVSTPVAEASPAVASAATTSAVESAANASASPAVPAPLPVPAPGPGADASQEPVAAGPAAPAEAVVIAHVLIKHKDVANPVSKAPRNKGAPVTRSLDDARRTAAALRMKNLAAAPVSEAAFESAVLQFSECATAKKKGRMGRIERGQFAKAFEDAAFGLEVHHVSEPVETPLGVHLLMRLPDEAA
uniref:Peptidyl-prolyl cis-trans isomerase n=1 Tax=Neobodo designis TaxID=312471 RepID=A0A7S1KZR4_NEODS